MAEIIEVRVNCGSKTEAERIAHTAVEQRLAASANLHGVIASTYHWKQSIETAEEVPLTLKTTDAHFEALTELIETLHAYETPSITGFRIQHISAAYRDWVIRETESANL